MTRDLLVVVGACAAAAAMAAHPVANHAAGQAHANISIDGVDASSNDAGVQARWTDDGSHAGVFIGGATLDDAARGNLPEGRAALVLAVAEHGPGGRLLTYLWTPRVERTTRGTDVQVPDDDSGAGRALLRKAAVRFSDIRPIQPLSHARAPRASKPAGAAAVQPTPTPDRGSKRSRGSGSTQAGLPALSMDSGARVIQAGWLDGTRRYGVFARGRWRMAAGASLMSDQPDDWLVAFELDHATGRIALLRAVQGHGGVEIGYEVNGNARTFDRASSAWAVRALEWLDRAAY